MTERQERTDSSQCALFGLPLLGSNQDSPDPESGGSGPGSGSTDRTASPRASSIHVDATNSHERPHYRKCARCTHVREHGTRTRRGRTSLQSYCKLCMVDFHRAWRHGPGREKFAHSNGASKERFPERDAARHALQVAVARGKVRRGPCVVCGSTASEGHHEDYSRPLDVVWLCRRHHRAHDLARRARRSA